MQRALASGSCIRNRFQEFRRQSEQTIGLFLPLIAFGPIFPRDVKVSVSPRSRLFVLMVWPTDNGNLPAIVHGRFPVDGPGTSDLDRNSWPVVVSTEVSLQTVHRHNKSPLAAKRMHRGVAQLVEHRSPKPRVGGSSPFAPASAANEGGQTHRQCAVRAQPCGCGRFSTALEFPGRSL